MKKSNSILHQNYSHPDSFSELLGFKFKKIDKKKFTFSGEVRILPHHLSSW